MRIGTRKEVMNGNAKQTAGGLKKKDLKYNKYGKIVSKELSNRAKKKENRLQKSGYYNIKGQFGSFKMNGGTNGIELKRLNNKNNTFASLSRLNELLDIVDRYPFKKQDNYEAQLLLLFNEDSQQDKYDRLVNILMNLTKELVNKFVKIDTIYLEIGINQKLINYMKSLLKIILASNKNSKKVTPLNFFIHQLSEKEKQLNELRKLIGLINYESLFNKISKLKINLTSNNKKNKEAALNYLIHQLNEKEKELNELRKLNGLINYESLINKISKLKIILISNNNSNSKKVTALNDFIQHENELKKLNVLSNYESLLNKISKLITQVHPPATSNMIIPFLVKMNNIYIILDRISVFFDIHTHFNKLFLKNITNFLEKFDKFKEQIPKIWQQTNVIPKDDYFLTIKLMSIILNSLIRLKN